MFGMSSLVHSFNHKRIKKGTQQMYLVIGMKIIMLPNSVDAMTQFFDKLLLVPPASGSLNTSSAGSLYENDP